MADPLRTEVLVVGAGVAGLLAARELAAAGRRVTVVDKGRGLGGRLATRRIPAGEGVDARLDHGAQFFTVRADRFRSLVAPLAADGLVRTWTHGFAEPADGHARYSVTQGMTALAKHLGAEVVARGGIVHTGCRLADLVPDGDGVVATESDETTRGDEPRRWRAERVICTAPTPQAIDLLGDAAPAPLHDVAYDPTLCLLGLLDRPVDVAGALGPAGAVQRPDGLPFEFVSDNRAKGASPVPALTAHLTGTESAARWDDPDADTLAFLLDAVAPLLGGAEVRDPQLKRWRYATPTTLHPEPTLVDGRIAFAGDAFGRAAVEGAALSGWAAAEATVAG